MSLANLQKIGQLKEHPVQTEEIERLLIAAQRNLRDAGIGDISPETRFDAAYKAIMQCALATLMMHGYRPDTNKPGQPLKLAEFKRVLAVNPDIAARYEANRLRVIRQVKYSLHNEN